MKDTIISVLDMYKAEQLGADDAEKLIAALWDGGEEAHLPWDNDNKLRVVAYRGRRLIKRGEAGEKSFELTVNGAVEGNVECWGSAIVNGSVNGSVTTGVSAAIEGCVAMQVNAGTSVTIQGDNYAPINAGTGVTVNGCDFSSGGAAGRKDKGFDDTDIDIGNMVNDMVNRTMRSAEKAVRMGMEEADKAMNRVRKTWEQGTGFRMETPPADGVEVVVRRNGEEIAVSGENGLALELSGEVPAVYSALGIVVKGDVIGNIQAGEDACCGDVIGNIEAGGAVTCGDVAGDVCSGGNLDCGDIGGDVNAGGNVDCGDVGGDVNAGGNVDCGDVGGDVNAGGDVSCSEVGGSIRTDGKVACGEAADGIEE